MSQCGKSDCQLLLGSSWLLITPNYESTCRLLRALRGRGSLISTVITRVRSALNLQVDLSARTLQKGGGSEQMEPRANLVWA